MSNGRSYSPDDWGACGGVNNINLATNIVVNGGGEISPRSSHPQGSPLRNNLALKLKSPISTLQVYFIITTCLINIYFSCINRNALNSIHLKKTKGRAFIKSIYLVWLCCKFILKDYLNLKF